MVHDGRYLTHGASGLTFSSTLPGPDQELIVRNLSRPHLDLFGRDDDLIIRFAKSGSVLRPGATLRSMLEGQIRSVPVLADRPTTSPDELWDVDIPSIVTLPGIAAHMDSVLARWPNAHRKRTSGYATETEMLLRVSHTHPSVPIGSEATRTIEAYLSMHCPLNVRYVRALDLLTGIPPAAMGLAPTLQYDVVGLVAILGFTVVDGKLMATLGGADKIRIEPLGTKIHLQGPDGTYLTTEASGAVYGDRAEPFATEELLLGRMRTPFSDRFFHGDWITLRGGNGARISAPLPLVAAGQTLGARDGSGHVPLELNIVRVDGPGEVVDGDRVRFTVRNIGGGAHLSVDAGGRRTLAHRPAPTDPRTIFTIRFTQTLRQTWSDTAQDHASVARGEAVRRAGYRQLHGQARVLLSPRPGSAALESFFHQPTSDTITTATEQGLAVPLSQNWDYLGIQGHVYQQPELGTVPLKLYFHETRRDNLLAATTDDDRNAGFHGYRFGWVEGYAAPPDAPPPPPPPPSSGSPSTVPLTQLLSPAVAAAITGGIPLQVGGRPITVPVPELRPIARPPRTALVLSGGGAKGCFEAGAASVLWEQRYQPELICGVSVGAINAAKLAEGPGAAAELVAWWRELAKQQGAVFHDSFYTKAIETILERLVGRLADTGIAALIGSILGSLLLPGFVVGAHLGGVIGALAGKSLSDLDEASLRLVNAILVIAHSIHSMEPLRRLIASRLDVDRLRQSPIHLRIGITCASTGQFFTVSAADDTWTAEPLRAMGFVEVEPDHQLGSSWLDRPLYGTEGYVMRLSDAIYASSALPGFMEPFVVDPRTCEQISVGSQRYTLLRPDLPPGLREVLDAYPTPERAPPNTSFGLRLEQALDRFFASYLQNTQEARRAANRGRRDGSRGRATWSQYLFDGGLRDTMPIRTALRLGARDITVISGDRLQQFHHPFVSPNTFDRGRATDLFSLFGGSNWIGVDLGSIPALQHIMGLLGIWFNETARSDLLLSVAQSEFLGWVQKAYARLDAPSKTELERDIRRYWDQRGPVLLGALGGSHWLGGHGTFDYGHLPYDRAKITLIAPDREIIDALAFEDYDSVVSGIELGRVAAQSRTVLSDHL